jgi:excisionase family DNA binding protein
MTEEYTVKEAAILLATSERTVRRWLREKKLVGRHVEGRTGLPTWRVQAASVRAARNAAKDAATPMRVMRSRQGTAEELQALRAEVAMLTEEVQRLSEMVQRLLPPAPQERLSWWQRLWGRRTGLP